ncbi:hypothetical protein MUO65_01295, partial [bacterium]|nr:hypothetical protein [bacterium]
GREQIIIMANYLTEEKYAESDPVTTLSKARSSIREMKASNRELSKRADLLLKNNSKFAELVMVLERKVKALTEEQAKIYKYSYGKGWIEKDSADPKKLKIVKGRVSVQEINTQMEEILRLIKRHSQKE